MSNNIIEEKSFRFAIDIINTYKDLCEKKEYVLSKQLLRSGTSIGANVKEALRGQINKRISRKRSLNCELCIVHSELKKGG